MNDPHRHCKKQKAYAWAKYYQELRNQLPTYVAVRQVVRTIDRNKPLPPHITKEFMEMADELKKRFTCPICIDDVETGNVQITGCGHFYHPECLDQLKSSANPICAVCRCDLH